MNNKERMALLMNVFNTVFSSKAANTDITRVIVTSPFLAGGQKNGRWFKDSTTGQPTLRGFDLDINLGDRVIMIRCLEQNPNKRDFNGNLKPLANMARQGHQIMWVIDRKVQSGGFLGRIQDGQWIPSEQRAYTQVSTPNYPAGFTNTRNNFQQASSAPAGWENNADQLYQQDLENGMYSGENVPEIPDGYDIPDYVLQNYANLGDPYE